MLDPGSPPSVQYCFEHAEPLVQVPQDRTCAGRITKQLRRLLKAFLIRRRVVLEVKHPPRTLDGRGAEAGFQDRDGESITLPCCPLTIDGPLMIDGEATILGLEHPPPVVVERHVDVLDADVPNALSM